MKLAVFLGDELAAAGWRLAGLQVRSPRRGEEAAALAWARAQAPLVLVAADLAAAIAEAVLRPALAAPAPLVLLVPSLQGEVPWPDLAQRLRAQLGLEA